MDKIWWNYSEEVETHEARQDFMGDQGYGFEMVRYSARRKDRRTVIAYGKTLKEALLNLDEVSSAFLSNRRNGR